MQSIGSGARWMSLQSWASKRQFPYIDGSSMTKPFNQGTTRSIGWSSSSLSRRLSGRYSPARIPVLRQAVASISDSEGLPVLSGTENVLKQEYSDRAPGCCAAPHIGNVRDTALRNALEFA